MRHRYQRMVLMTTRSDTVVTSFNKRPSDDLVFADVVNQEKFKNLSVAQNLLFTQTVGLEYIPAPVTRTYQVGKQMIVMMDVFTYQTGPIYVNEVM